jgi:RNA polymerase primary sigma factor
MAAEKRPSPSHRGPEVAGGPHLTIEEKYDEVRQLINIGKEKGYLLYDEVNELLPSEITSSEELDDLFNTFGSAGIEVIDSDQKYLRDDVKPIDRTSEGAEELELDLTPGALDKTNDPVRMYLREMGTVPLLTREGEVAIAKRIEEGERVVIAALFRAELTLKEIRKLVTELKAGKLKVEDFIKIEDAAASEAVLKKERAKAIKIISRVIELQQRMNRLVAKGRTRLSERARGTLSGHVGKAQVLLTEEMNKLNLNAKLVEKLTTPIKDLGDRSAQAMLDPSYPLSSTSRRTNRLRAVTASS